jgi:hypothetical protein
MPFRHAYEPIVSIPDRQYAVSHILSTWLTIGREVANLCALNRRVRGGPMDDASQHLLAAISRQLSDITANVQDVRERIIRLESQDYSPRLAKLETDNDDLKNRLTVIETRGQMFSAGVSAGVSVLVTVVGAALVHLFKG